jgi:hypothetical protein
MVLNAKHPHRKRTERCLETKIPGTGSLNREMSRLCALHRLLGLEAAHEVSAISMLLEIGALFSYDGAPQACTD